MLAIRNIVSPTAKHFFNVFDEIFESPTLYCDSIKNPMYDIIENDREYIVEFSLGGIKKENISVCVEKNDLIIKAERIENKDVKYNRKETLYGKYEKLFTLPDYVDKNNICGSFTDGLLAVSIPKIIDEKMPGKRIIEIM